MPLQLTGPITMADIRDEFGGVNPFSLQQVYRGGGLVPSSVLEVPDSGPISINQFYGTSAATGGNPATVSANIPDQSAKENAAAVTYDLDNYFNGATSYSISGNPTGVTLTSNILTIDFSAAAVQSGTTITVTGTNGDGSASQDFTFTVIALAPPTVTSSIVSQTGTEGDAAVTIDLNNHFNGATSYSLSGNPVGISVSSNILTIDYTALAVQSGTTISVTATNVDGSVSQDFTVTVEALVLPEFSSERGVMAYAPQNNENTLFIPQELWVNEFNPGWALFTKVNISGVGLFDRIFIAQINGGCRVDFRDGRVAVSNQSAWITGSTVYPEGTYSVFVRFAGGVLNVWVKPEGGATSHEIVNVSTSFTQGANGARAWLGIANGSEPYNTFGAETTVNWLSIGALWVNGSIPTEAEGQDMLDGTIFPEDTVAAPACNIDPVAGTDLSGNVRFSRSFSVGTLVIDGTDVPGDNPANFSILRDPDNGEPVLYNDGSGDKYWAISDSRTVSNNNKDIVLLSSPDRLSWTYVRTIGISTPQRAVSDFIYTGNIAGSHDPFFLFYSGVAVIDPEIYLLTSSDMTNWTADAANPVFSNPAGPGSGIEDFRMVRLPNGTWAAYFEQDLYQDGQAVAVGAASNSNTVPSGTWTLETQQIFPSLDPHLSATAFAANPSVIRDDEFIYLFYEVVAFNSPKVGPRTYMRRAPVASPFTPTEFRQMGVWTYAGEDARLFSNCVSKEDGKFMIYCQAGAGFVSDANDYIARVECDVANTIINPYDVPVLVPTMPQLGTPTNTTGLSSDFNFTIPAHDAGDVFLIVAAREGFNEVEPSLAIADANKIGEYGSTNSTTGSRHNLALFTWVGDGTTAQMLCSMGTADTAAISVYPVTGADETDLLGAMVFSGQDRGNASDQFVYPTDTTVDSSLAVAIFAPQYQADLLVVGPASDAGWTRDSYFQAEIGTPGQDLYVFTKEMATAGSPGTLEINNGTGASFDGAVIWFALKGGQTVSSGSGSGGGGGTPSGADARLYALPISGTKPTIGYEPDVTVEPTVLPVDMTLTSGSGSFAYETTRDDITGPRLIVVTKGGRLTLTAPLNMTRNDTFITGAPAGSLPEIWGDVVQMRGERMSMDHIRLAGGHGGGTDTLQVLDARDVLLKNLTIMNSADEMWNIEGRNRDAWNVVSREILGIYPMRFNGEGTDNHNYGPYWMDNTYRNGAYNSLYIGMRRRAFAFENPAEGAIMSCVFVPGTASSFITAGPVHGEEKDYKFPLTIKVDLYGNIYNWVPSNEALTNLAGFANTAGVTASVYDANNLISDGVWGTTVRTSSATGNAQQVMLTEFIHDHLTEIVQQAELWQYVEDRAGARPAERAAVEQAAINEAKAYNVPLRGAPVDAAPAQIESGFNPANFTGLNADGRANIWVEVDRLNGTLGGVTRF